MFYNSCVLYKPVNFSSRAYKSIYRRLYPYLVLVNFSNKTIIKCHCEIYLIVKYKIQQFWFLNQVLRCQDADSRLKWETGETRAARTGQSTKCSENKRFPGLLPIAWRFKIPSWNKEKRTRKRLPKYKKEKTMPLLLIQTSSGMEKYHTFPLLFWTLSLRGDWNKFPFPFKRKEKIVMNFERDNSLI